MSAEKQNPWLDEGSKYDKENRKKRDVRDLKFADNKTHTVRILPSKNPSEFPFCGYKQHWIPQNGSIIGRAITHEIDERCVVCDWVSTQWDEIHRLKEEEDMTDKSPEVEAILEKVSKVTGKTRYDMNVLHREDLYVVNEETKEKVMAPKRMSVGGTVYKEIFGFAKKWGSPSNEKDGYDLEIKTSGEGKKREYSTLPDRNVSPLSEDEIKVLDKCCDLKEFRKSSSIIDIKKSLENAKAPYDEILRLIKDDTAATTSTKSTSKDKPSDVEKEIEEAVKPATKEPEQKKVKETVVEEKKQEAAPKEEPKQTKPEPVDDEHNIEVYECKGDYDENDKMCSDCPVKSDCEEVHPFYVKAKQAGINIDPRRPTKEVVDDVKKTEEPAQTSKRGKKIPF